MVKMGNKLCILYLLNFVYIKYKIILNKIYFLILYYINYWTQNFDLVIVNSNNKNNYNYNTLNSLNS